jgi:hypothetical protein
MTVLNNSFKTASIFIILLALVSCQAKKTGGSGIVKIDTGQLPAQQKDLSEYLEDIYVVPLETTQNNLLGGLEVSDQDDSDFFYLSYENQTIYRFNASGQFLNSFCHLGKGPGEYAKVRNIHIIPGTQTILLSDVRQSKMLLYDYSGTFIREFALPPSTARFAVLNNNLIALHAGKMTSLKPDDNIRNDLIFMDMQGKIVGRKFPFDMLLWYEFSNAFTRPDADGSYYYSKQFDFNIYRVRDTSQPEVFMRLDYGNSMASLDDLKGPSMEDFMVLQKEGKRLSTDNVINTYRQFALINFTGRRLTLIVINKKTGEQMMFGTDSLFSMGRYHGLPISIPRDSYKDHFLFRMEAIDLYQAIRTLTEDQIKILKKQVKGFDRILNIKEEDNPVLFYYKFRDF